MDVKWQDFEPPKRAHTFLIPKKPKKESACEAFKVLSSNFNVCLSVPLNFDLLFLHFLFLFEHYWPLHETLPCSQPGPGKLLPNFCLINIVNGRINKSLLPHNLYSDAIHIPLSSQRQFHFHCFSWHHFHSDETNTISLL